jgi:hypothetical protein
MRKSWPFALAVVVVGGLAGGAIAGRPEPADPFVLEPTITAPIVASSTSEANTTATTARATTTTPATTPATTTSTAATTTSVAATTTSTSTSTTTAASTTTTIAAPTPRNQVRLVLANGDGRFKLASITASRLRPLGYVINLGDALQTVKATLIYYRPGFDDEAELVATDISVPDAIIAALPTNVAQTVTNADRGDVIVVLGPDAPR